MVGVCMFFLLQAGIGTRPTATAPPSILIRSLPVSSPSPPIQYDLHKFTQHRYLPNPKDFCPTSRYLLHTHIYIHTHPRPHPSPIHPIPSHIGASVQPQSIRIKHKIINETHQLQDNSLQSIPACPSLHGRHRA
ncbi:hypothetical protein CPC08DRAFT_104697 [Agrocybe pediades]|nr:hypothetical protein CPC08DRAFT_104697 [Agrocybe pediades]